MAKLILFLFLISPVVGFAQHMLGDDEKTISTFLKKAGYSLIETKALEGKSKKLVFQDGADDRFSYTYFLNDNGVCDFHMIIAPKAALVAFVKGFNEDDTKVSDTVWVNKSNTVKYELKLTKDNPFFAIYCTPL